MKTYKIAYQTMDNLNMMHHHMINNKGFSGLMIQEVICLIIEVYIHYSFYCGTVVILVSTPFL